MSNVASPFGFRAVNAFHSGAAQPKPRRYFIPATDATTLFLGDIVKLAGGFDPIKGVPTVTAITNVTSDIPVGIVVGIDQVAGVLPTSESLSLNYRPASVALYVEVLDDPDVILEARVLTTAISTTVTQNFKPALGAGGSTISGISSMSLDGSTKATTNTLMFQGLGFTESPDNDITSVYARVLCKFNVHQFTAATGSTGV